MRKEMENLSKQMPIARSHNQTTNPEVSSAGTSTSPQQ